MKSDFYDLIVIGGGKGGKTFAMEQAKAGKRVAMVEKGMIGGSCINVACIPTKTMVVSAKAFHLAKKLDTFGVEAQNVRLVMQKVIERKNRIVKAMIDANYKSFIDSGMEFILGEARFIDKNCVEVDVDGKKRALRSDTIVINTGCRPRIPDIKGLDSVSFLTSEDMLNLVEVPEHLVIFGGGYIGLEFAQIFARFGAKVSIIELHEEFLAQEDRDIAREIYDVLQEEGIEIHLNQKFCDVEQKGKIVKLHLEEDGKKKVLEASHFLVAVGRVACTQALNLEVTDVTVDKRGFIQTDEFLQTNQKGVWAVGDVKGGAQFTHLSLDDYRFLKHNIDNPDAKKSIVDRLVPYTVFIDPELSRIGLTEKEALERGFEIKIAKMPVAKMARANTMSETKGVMKVVLDAKSDLILGGAILAPHGGEIMALLQMAMNTGITHEKLRDTMYSHPTLVEGFNLLFSHPFLSKPRKVLTK
jgi:probable pyridine nucleotide-disulfide oxidoreductase